MHSTPWRLYVSPRAQKDLDGLSDEQAARLRFALTRLAGNPFESGLDIKKLTGKKSAYRLRVGSYRVLFKLDGSNGTIAVERVSDRKDAY